MRALLWKEWAESRRAIAGGLITLMGLPLFLLVFYRVFIEDEWLVGPPTMFAMLSGPVIAATWGAHVFCKDLGGWTGRFLLAQPVGVGRVVWAKGIVAVLVMTGLLLCPWLLDFVGVSLGGWDWYSVGWTEYASYLLALSGVLGVSFLAATVFRRLIPAVLAGLAVAVCVAFGPFFLLGETRILHVMGVPSIFTFFGAIGLLLWVGAFGGAGLLARRLDRTSISLRAFSWAGVGIVLVGTAMVTGPLANNTVVTHTFEAGLRFGGPGVFTARGNSVYWLGPAFVRDFRDDSPREQWDGTIRKVSFDDRGNRTADTWTTVSIPARFPIRSPGVLEARPDADGRNIAILYAPLEDSQPERAASSKHRLRLARYVLGGEEAVRVGAEFTFDEWFTWCVDGERLFRLLPGRQAISQGEDRRAITLEASSLSGQRAERLGELRISGTAPGGVTVEGSILTIWPMLQSPVKGLGRLPHRLIRVDVSDPAHMRILLTSQEYPSPTALLAQWIRSEWSHGLVVAIQGDRLAMASSGGLWVYELGPAGDWRLLGQREATLIEVLAGRRPDKLVWSGDRIYELSYTFGLLVYDVSDPAHPRRVAHSGGGYCDVEPLQNGTVALPDAYRKVEIHRLP